MDCRNCRFFHVTGEQQTVTLGECRKKAPGIAKNGGACWPAVFAEEELGCGDFEPKSGYSCNDACVVLNAAREVLGDANIRIDFRIFTRAGVGAGLEIIKKVRERERLRDKNFSYTITTGPESAEDDPHSEVEQLKMFLSSETKEE